MTRPAIFVGLLLAILAVALQGVQGDVELDQVPSEVQCRPYIEKALKDLGTGSLEESSVEVDRDVDEEGDEGRPSLNEQGDEPANDDDNDDDKEIDQQLDDRNNEQDSENDGNDGDSANEEKSEERSTEDNSNETDDGDGDNVETVEVTSVETAEDQSSDVDNYDGSDEKTDGESVEGADDDDNRTDETGTESTETAEDDDSKTETTINEESESDSDEKKNDNDVDDDGDPGEVDETKNNSTDDNEDSKADIDDDSKANDDDGKSEETDEATSSAAKELVDNSGEDKDDDGKSDDDNSKETTEDTDKERKDSKEDVTKENVEDSAEDDSKSRGKREIEEDEGVNVEGSEESQEGEDKEPMPEEDLIQEIEVPENLRPRDHINQLLKLDQENEVKEKATQRVADIVLRDLKRLYDTAIKPLETLYKYRDLSNRHFGDPEIFSKPLVLFMGPWSGGKSSIINYLLDVEYKQNSLRTGAEPSPAYFNILMHGEEEEVLDGTQLAADWTFSGLQKFGQGMLDRLRGLRLNNKLLEKVNIVEIPGILEIRKQVQRLFPFNDACQWFIDRADIIFLVYDPSKLDVGPETEAILDQLKGREYQTRIVLNKADQVKPEELMRVQGALIWNISPLMSSAEPPIMYSVSLWSLPYEAGAPTRLLYAQERAFLRDLRSAIDKRVEHKIASARRFAVRVRNHAKMVDCYLTTYYNHKTFFGNKKEISDKIIENPQNYHIYEGLSTLTNISRYDLPDPDVYRDFFRLNSLYDFQPLSSTCTYFRGCPINRLDVAIAYDLPELVGKYKKSVEAASHEGETSTPPS